LPRHVVCLLISPMRADVLLPEHPERVCWGCSRYCPADDLACGNGTVRTLHPSELFGDEWAILLGDRESREQPRPTPDAGNAEPPKDHRRA
jgi:hypothetical protein